MKPPLIKFYKAPLHALEQMTVSKNTFLSFQQARRWAQTQKFSSSQDFRRLDPWPKFIPRNPNYVYRHKGWIDWYDFLGTDRPKRRKNPNGWRSFDKARDWARGLGLSSETEWRIFRKTKLPSDIPTNPNREYAKLGWKSWGDFLGTANTKYSDVARRSFEDVKEWARLEGIKTQREWRQRIQRDDFPSDIKKAPDKGYAEFVSWPDFLDNESRISNRRTTKWRSFEDAKKWAQSIPVISSTHWLYLAKIDKIPRDIPTNVNQVYKEFTTWRDFLEFNIKGKSSKVETVLAIELSNFFELSHQQIISTELGPKWVDIVCVSKRLVIEFDGSHWHKKTVKKDTKTTEDLMKVGWRVIRVREQPLQKIFHNDLLVKRGLSEIEICKAVVSHLVACEIINEEHLVKKAHEYVEGERFLSLKEDFLNPGWLSFEKARNFVIALNLKSESDWRKYRENLPSDIPRNPNEVYLSSWKGWGHWLGTGNPRPNNDLMTYRQARKYIRSKGIRTSREYQQHRKLNPGSRLPANPEKRYGKEGWETWHSFTGQSRIRKRSEQSS